MQKEARKHYWWFQKLYFKILKLKFANCFENKYKSTLIAQA